MCWNCVWGVPKQIGEIYLEALRKLDGDDTPLLYGPAHVVWEDYNFQCAQVCLNDFDLYRGDYTDSQLEIVRWSLEKLLELPDEIIDYLPNEYDGIDEHYELYPPDIEMLKY